ncbi:MAG: hypothetical protein LBR30_02705 [Clostridioides sp.]|jgi:hypothetical protein|nr:hypothetical protein [Clostridioides sp.]
MKAIDVFRLVCAVLASGFGIASYVRLIVALIKNQASTNAFSWIIFTALTACGFLMTFTQGVGVIGLITPFLLFVSCAVVMVLAFVKSDKEKRKAGSFDIICLVLAGGLFVIGLFGSKIFTTIDPKLVSNICMSVFVTTAIVPTYMRIVGIIKGNTEIPSSMFMLLIRNLLMVVALDVFNFFTLYGPFINCLSALSIMLFAMHYNKKRGVELKKAK